MYTPLDLLSMETWILILTIFLLLRWYIHKQWEVLKNLGIPHDPPSVLNIGNLTEILKHPTRFYKFDLEKKEKFGLVYGFYVWLQPRISIADPDVLKQVFIKQAATFREREKTLSKINGKELNTALTAATGKQWKRIRTTLTPAFSTSKLKDMINIFAQGTDKMVESLHKIAKEKDGRFFTKELYGRLTMDLICSAVFGVNVHSQEGESELVSKTQKIFSVGPFGLFITLMRIFPCLETLAENLNISLFKKSDIAYYNRLVDMVIKNKKEAVEKREDIMQEMLSAEITEEEAKSGATRGLTRTEIVGNSLIMIFAGYETTANTLSFLSYCLACNPNAQKQVYDEIKDAKEKFGDLTYEAINSMKYLDMCMKESQRIYPAAPRNVRYTEVEVTVKGITIPANTHVVVPIYGLHHDEEYWDEPWQFIPERFEDMSKIDPMVYQPFGAGPRNCIGMRFAILEVKMAMCKVLLNFKLEPCVDTPKPPLETSFRGSMQPDKDLYLKATPRRAGAARTENILDPTTNAKE